MEEAFLKKIIIKSVRHIKNVEIPLSEMERKNLIVTGKNGVGKTSFLIALVSHLMEYFGKGSDGEIPIGHYIGRGKNTDDEKLIQEYERQFEFWTGVYASAGYNETWHHIGDSYLQRIYNEASIFTDSTSDREIYNSYRSGKFIMAFFPADRILSVDTVKSIENITLSRTSSLTDNCSKIFLKYLASLKAKQAFATVEGNLKLAESINQWFIKFDKMLKEVLEDDSIKLNFDSNTLQFDITCNEKEAFDFNTLSSGYSAILSIIIELLLRVPENNMTFFDTQGIVIIDEIEAHLHLELQKKIMPILTTMFPKIQFILSTHSPFILSSTPNAVIYDLQNRTLVKDGLNTLPYQGIVEGYFNVNTLSQQLLSYFSEYKKIAKKSEKSDDDYRKLAELELYLDEIPDYLAIDFSAEYKRIKLELMTGGSPK